MPKPFWSRYLTFAVLALLYLPVAVLVITSFNASRFGGSWAGFTWSWYAKLFHEPSIWSALINSLIVATYSSLFSTTLGVTAALALYHYRSPLQRAHLGLLLSPLVMPDILMGISLLLLFVSIHLKLSLLTVFLAHTTFSVSYVAMIVRTRMETIDRAVIEAAKDLGASDAIILFKIIIPLTLSGIISGIIMVFVPALTSFVISDLLGGGKVLLIGNVIEQEFMQGTNWNLGSGLSVVLMIFVIASMALMNIFDKDGGGTAVW